MKIEWDDSYAVGCVFVVCAAVLLAIAMFTKSCGMDFQRATPPATNIVEVPSTNIVEDPK